MNSASVDDHYSGFEGEPEITVDLISARGVRSRVRLWEGHFDAIMRGAVPGAAGWTGLALPYHLHSAWYDAPWELPRAELATARLQWADLASSLHPELQAAHAAVLKLLLEAESDAALRLMISYS
jgi:hypothetical protein